MPARHLVLSVLFAIIVFVVVGVLNGAFPNFGFTPLAVISIGIGIIASIAAFAWEYFERRNSQNN
jgi:hypothetical protein